MSDERDIWEGYRAKEHARKGFAMSRRVRDIAKAHGLDSRKALERFVAESMVWALTQVQDSLPMVKGGLLWQQTKRETADADVLFADRKNAAQLFGELGAAAAVLREHGFSLTISELKVVDMGGRGTCFRAPVRCTLGDTVVHTQLDVSFGRLPEGAVETWYHGMFKGAPFRCFRQPWGAAAADRLGAIWQHGAGNTRLKDYRDLYRMREQGLDDRAIARGLVRYFDDRGMDRSQLLKVPDGLSFEYAIANKAPWLERMVRVDPSLPADFGEVVDEIHHWWLQLRSVLVDMAAAEELEERLQAAGTPSLAPEFGNVVSLAAYRRARG